MELEEAMLREVTQKERQRPDDLMLLWNIKKIRVKQSLMEVTLSSQ